jgi:hypothetical protein
MDILSNFLVFIVDVTAVPHAVRNVIIVEFVEDAIASQNNEIVMLLNLKNLNICQCTNYIWVSPSKLIFCLRVSKGSGD